MKAVRRILRLLMGAVEFALLVGACLQFTGVPWACYRWLSGDGGEGFAGEATHVWVPGGSGVPGRSALMRTWYGAEAWKRDGGRGEVWVTLPLGVEESRDARAYAGELRMRGVSEEGMRVLGGGRNTREQAVRVVEALRAEGREGPAKVEVATSPEHVRRCVGALRKAAAEAGVAVKVRGRAAMDLSLDDAALEWEAEELEAEGRVVGRTADGELLVEVERAAGDGAGGVGGAMWLRYGVWGNLQYSVDAVREGAALLYYWLKGWVE